MGISWGKPKTTVELQQRQRGPSKRWQYRPRDPVEPVRSLYYFVADKPGVRVFWAPKKCVRLPPGKFYLHNADNGQFIAPFGMTTAEYARQRVYVQLGPEATRLEQLAKDGANNTSSDGDEYEDDATVRERAKLVADLEQSWKAYKRAHDFSGYQAPPESASRTRAREDRTARRREGRKRTEEFREPLLARPE